MDEMAEEAEELRKLFPENHWFLASEHVYLFGCAPRDDLSVLLSLSLYRQSRPQTAKVKQLGVS